MAGIIHKIEETLHIGGHKPEENKHKAEEHKGEHCKPEAHGHGEHKGEHKEGLVEKIKDKIHGDGAKGECEGEKKKKKKEKKKHEDGHHHGDSSSSDSD
ncbi:hypothetical protein [Homoserinimonas sp. OAct 916]|uniref:hypothetical protein n=1 Tax=Homoserinimonas sp. OAct 916 TaxID=2211450 RepID=UPI000DBE419B|nr:hypothetical protein [Homoserinimonas sp. OAct 916]